MLLELKENLDDAQSRGQIHEISSIVQKIRIILCEDMDNIPYQKFISTGLLNDTLTFLNFDFRLFSLLRFESLW